MTLSLRAKLVVCGAPLYAGLSGLYPVLVAPSTLKFLGSVFALLFSALLWFISQFNGVTGVGVLSSREMERYTLKRGDVRGRMFHVAAICAAAPVLLWLLSVSSDNINTYVLGGLAGFTVFGGISYLLILSLWFEQLASFSDRLRLLEQQRKEHEATIKRLSDASKMEK